MTDGKTLWGVPIIESEWVKPGKIIMVDPAFFRVPLKLWKDDNGVMHMAINWDKVTPTIRPYAERLERSLEAWAKREANKGLDHD